jgi:hypothetical protein
MGKDCQVWQYATAIVAIIATGALVFNSNIDSSVFASLVTLCLGYVFGKQQATNGNGAK